jgi:hypothetical protein
MTTRTGGCACGAIRYEVEGEAMFQVACHCRACQYSTGGAPTLAMIFPKTALKVLKGEPRTYWSEGDSGAQVGRCFCEACGSPVFSEPPGGQIAVVKVGGLDDPSGFKIQGHIWTETAQPWHRFEPDAMQVPRNIG